MKSLTSKFASSPGWALLLILFLGAGLLVSACGDEEVPAPTTPAPPPPPPPPAPEPEPEPEPPATPTGLMVSETTENSITWTWNAVEGATAYAVQISMDEMFGDDDAIALALTATYTASDLPPATTIYARVAAGVGTSLEDALLSDWSTHVTGMTATPPPPPEPPAVPSGLQVSASGNDFVEWSWSAVAGADGYEVQFSTNEMFDNAETIGRTADETSYRRQPLPAGTTAFVRVRSYSGTGEDRLESEWSTHVTGMTDQPMPPAIPANLQASACGEGCLEWTWDEVEGADGYEVQYSLDDERFTSDDATAELAATETSYRLTDLAADMDVYLRVRSFAGSGADRLQSEWSTHTTGMTEAPPPMAPAAPTGVEASAGDDFIEWNWNAVSGAEGYEVQISEDPEFTASDPTRDVGAALTYRQGDLDYDTRRYLQVRAYIGSGADRLSSDWSAEATAVTSLPPPPPPSPGVPSGLTATASGEDFVTWTWRAVSDVDGYQVQYSSNEAFTSTDPMEDVSAETLSYTREDLEGGTSHYLRVRSFIVVMEERFQSGWSSHVTGMTDLPRPAAPTGLAVDADATDHDSIGWEWDAVAGVDGYEAQFSSSQPFVDTDQIFNTDTTSHVVHNLAAEANGYLRVRSVIGTGSDRRLSDWSATSTGTTGTAPAPDPLAAPENFESTAQTNDSITLGWDQVAGAETYEVEFREAGASSWDDADCGDGSNEVDGTTCVVSGLDEGTDYEFRVRAIPEDDTAHADGEWAEAEGTTEGAQTTITPGGMGDLNLTWKATGTTITWTWEPAAGATYEWEVLTSYSDATNPCADVDWSSPTGTGAAFSATATPAQGAVNGICVRSTDEDNRALSFAWATNEPLGAGADPAAGVTVNDQSVTTALTWTTLSITGGFEYEIRVAADPQRDNKIHNGINGGDPTPEKDIQTACSAGNFVDQGDADVMFVLDEVTVSSGLRPYTGYLLCWRLANTTGATDWAVPTNNGELYTSPGKPSRPNVDSTRTGPGTTADTIDIVWNVPVRNDSNVPRLASGYNQRTISYRERWDHDSDTATNSAALPAPKEDACGADDDDLNDEWVRTTVATTPINTNGQGIAVGPVNFAQPAAPNSSSEDYDDLRVNLCVQARDGDRVGPWVMSGAYEVKQLTASN